MRIDKTLDEQSEEHAADMEREAQIKDAAWELLEACRLARLVQVLMPTDLQNQELIRVLDTAITKAERR